MNTADVESEPDPYQNIKRELTLPRIAAGLHAVSRTAAFVAVAVGILVLVGWWLDLERLKRIAPALVAMNPATAIGLIFLGLSLALLSRETVSLPSRRAGATFALLAALVGLANLLSVLSTWDFGIDRYLFRVRPGTADNGIPGHMAPNTALSLLLLGVALASIDRQFRRVRWPAQFLTVLAGMSSLLALTGYAYGVKSFYGVGTYIPMAVHTAATFLIVAIGVLCARPTHGIMAVVSSDSSGGVLVRRLLPAVLVLPAILGWVRLAGQQAMLFDGDVGLWLLIVLMMSVLAMLVGWNGKQLYRADLDRAMSERALSHQATHDALTHLPNRRMFIERLQLELDRAKRAGGSAAVLFVDLDLFKVINDSLGHTVGDELLLAAGARIAECLQSGEMLARMSGDEFTILLPNQSGADRAVEVSDAIQNAFGVPFTLGQNQVFTTASIGIALSEPDNLPLDLIRHADIAMYKAKAHGTASRQLYEPVMDVAAKRRLGVEVELRRALDEGELCVYYQPEVEIESGMLVGMEALIRWQHPERGLLSPGEFIPIAEETGLILPIGRWVLLEACRQAKQWQEHYEHHFELAVSVNISGKHFQQAKLVDEIAAVLKETGIDPAHLIIEITETIAMKGAESSIEILKRLKALGVLLAIDDFGTGFSSLSYLKRFPVDLLKIDKSFVDGVALKGPDSAIVQAIITLGHALGMRVIAEGVETEAQLNQLRQLGLELGQGYYFAAPLSDDLHHGMPSLLARPANWGKRAS